MQSSASDFCSLHVSGITFSRRRACSALVSCYTSIPPLFIATLKTITSKEAEAQISWLSSWCFSQQAFDLILVLHATESQAEQHASLFLAWLLGSLGRRLANYLPTSSCSLRVLTSDPEAPCMSQPPVKDCVLAQTCNASNETTEA